MSIKNLWYGRRHSNPLVASESSANNKKGKPASPQSLSGLCFKLAFVNWLLETQTSLFSLIQQYTLSFVPQASDLMEVSLTLSVPDAGGIYNSHRTLSPCISIYLWQSWFRNTTLNARKPHSSVIGKRPP